MRTGNEIVLPRGSAFDLRNREAGLRPHVVEADDGEHPEPGHRGVSDLVNKIELFVEHYNAKATPFMWTATAESILAKIQRLCAYFSGTRH